MKAFEHNAKQIEQLLAEAVPKTVEALIAAGALLDEACKKGGNGEVRAETVERLKAAMEALDWSID